MINYVNSGLQSDQFAVGDIIRLDARAGTIEVKGVDLANRAAVTPDISANSHGNGRELFEIFRQTVGLATDGAAVVV